MAHKNMFQTFHLIYVKVPLFKTRVTVECHELGQKIRILGQGQAQDSSVYLKITRPASCPLLFQPYRQFFTLLGSIFSKIIHLTISE